MKRDLLSGEKKIAIWGTGFIGFTTMANFAYSGIKTIGFDVVREKVDLINKGVIPIENLEYWLGFEIKPLVEAGLMKATDRWNDLINDDILVHFVCIPTEKEGEPYDNILIDVIEKLSNLKKIRRNIIVFQMLLIIVKIMKKCLFL